MATNEETNTTSTPRVMIASKRSDIKETVVLNDELPALEPGEIRLRVDKVGLSTNNLFYAQMGNAPFLKFFAVYPLDGHKELAIVPAWGLGTVIASSNPEFGIGEQFRGFFHMTNVVQMKAKRSAAGFEAYGGKRDKINPAYNGFIAVKQDASSPFFGEGDRSDLAMTSAPGALSGFMLYELLKTHDFYQGDSVILTSASSKLALATAVLLQSEREQGPIKNIVGYTSEGNRAFVEASGLFDIVVSYDEDIPASNNMKGILIDVAGDAKVYHRIKSRLVKALAVGGTHSEAESVTMSAFGPSALIKLLTGMMAPKFIADFAARKLNPKLEMFFAPSVAGDLQDRWGRELMDQKCDEALSLFVDNALDKHWITVDRSEDLASMQAAYRRIFQGEVPPSQAVILSLVNCV